MFLLNTLNRIMKYNKENKGLNRTVDNKVALSFNDYRIV